ncbi:MAG: hypothetical protein RR324_03395 [Cellulosilyticaceae bacterium]
MDYSKLKLSFVFLLAMCVIQFFTGLLIIHNALISILSLIAILLCIAALIFISSKTKE